MKRTFKLTKSLKVFDSNVSSKLNVRFSFTSFSSDRKVFCGIFLILLSHRSIDFKFENPSKQRSSTSSNSWHLRSTLVILLVKLSNAISSIRLLDAFIFFNSFFKHHTLSFSLVIFFLKNIKNV